jgi:hypothetical protein
MSLPKVKGKARNYPIIISMPLGIALMIYTLIVWVPVWCHPSIDNCLKDSSGGLASFLPLTYIGIMFIGAVLSKPVEEDRTGYIVPNKMPTKIPYCIKNFKPMKWREGTVQSPEGWYECDLCTFIIKNNRMYIDGIDIGNWINRFV